MDALQGEVRALHRDNEDLARRVEDLSSRVEALSTRLARAPAHPARDKDDAEKAPVIPPDLAVVRMEPRAPAAARGAHRAGEEPAAERSARVAPPISTAVPISPPDPERIEALARRGGRDIAAESDAELRRARGLKGDERARALEEFATRYPRHPSADNALVEASAASADVGRADAACDLARRAAADYPAGDALSEALERLAWCESRRGAREAERRLLERLVSEFPRTPAAARAGTRLATISGRTGETPEGPARSGP